MATNYSGNDGAVTARAAVVVSVPVDGDPLTAAILNDAVKELADIADHLETKAGLLDVASTWTTGQTFTAGMQSTGVSPSGSAAIFTGGPPNGNAVTATGDGTGSALLATGGDSSGAALTATGGAPNGHGLVAAGTGTGNAIQAGAGHIKLTGSNPASTAGFTNTLTPKNVCKAWANITIPNSPVSTACTINDGFNIDSAVIFDANTVEVYLQDDMANDNGAAVATGTGMLVMPDPRTNRVRLVAIGSLTTTPTLIDWTSGGGSRFVQLVVFGAQ